MRRTTKGWILAGSLMLGGGLTVGSPAAHAQNPVQAAPGYRYTASPYAYRTGPPRTVRRSPPVPYYGRDYLNRPLRSPWRGFGRDWTTARNVPYAKPWLRPFR